MCLQGEGPLYLIGLEESNGDLTKEWWLAEVDKGVLKTVWHTGGFKFFHPKQNSGLGPKNK